MVDVIRRIPGLVLVDWFIDSLEAYLLGEVSSKSFLLFYFLQIFELGIGVAVGKHDAGIDVFVLLGLHLNTIYIIVTKINQ